VASAVIVSCILVGYIDGSRRLFRRHGRVETREASSTICDHGASGLAAEVVVKATISCKPSGIILIMMGGCVGQLADKCLPAASGCCF
jgi:hypothetical protein